MNKKEQLFDVLTSLGYKPHEDADGDLVFRYQMKFFCALTGGEDGYVTIMLPQFGDVEEGEEHIALAVCNKLTRELKFAKVYVDSTLKSVSASCEFYYSDYESLKNNVENSIQVLGVIRTMYKKTQSELLNP